MKCEAHKNKKYTKQTKNINMVSCLSIQGEKMSKKTGIVIVVITLMLMQSIAVSALTESEAKQNWFDAKQVSREKQQIHRDAKIEFAGDKTGENRQAVVDTGKEALLAALDEAEAWLIWKDIEANENPELPDHLKETIHEDVQTNLDKIDELRTDVEGIDTQLELGIVFLKIVGKYLELITDVARDSGKILVYMGNTHLDTAEDYESKLRATAETIEDNGAIMRMLDTAKDDLDEARSNLEKAESSYEEVVLPGMPLIKFAEGNNYMRTARTNLLSALRNLNQAYMMLRGS